RMDHEDSLSRPGLGADSFGRSGRGGHSLRHLAGPPDADISFHEKTNSRRIAKAGTVWLARPKMLLLRRKPWGSGYLSREEAGLSAGPWPRGSPRRAIKSWSLPAVPP